VLVTVVPLLPVSPSAPVGDSVGLPVSVGDSVGLPVSVGVAVVVGDIVVVGDPVGDIVVVGDPVGDTVVVGVTVGVVVGVGVADGDGVAQAGVGVADGDGARLGSSGSAFLPEVDAPAPATTDVVSGPLKAFVSAAALHFAETLGLVVAPALDVVVPGPRPGLRTPFGDALALFVPVPLFVGEPLPSVRALPPPDPRGGMLSTVLLAWMIA
jgi:hypothetical protein